MKVLELLDEIEDIIETSSGFPLTGKVLVDAEEILRSFGKSELSCRMRSSRLSGLKMNARESLTRQSTNMKLC